MAFGWAWWRQFTAALHGHQQGGVLQRDPRHWQGSRGSLKLEAQALADGDAQQVEDALARNQLHQQQRHKANLQGWGVAGKWVVRQRIVIVSWGRCGGVQARAHQVRAASCGSSRGRWAGSRLPCTNSGTGRQRSCQQPLTMAARLLSRSAFSTKPNLEGGTEGCTGGSVTPCKVAGSRGGGGVE